jgi:hypothetical protein
LAREGGRRRSVEEGRVDKARLEKEIRVEKSRWERWLKKKGKEEV